MTDQFVATSSARAPRVRPTDIAQFVRLDQCERYLRLRMHERTVDGQFMGKYGVASTSIPDLLTRSGAAFERAVTAAIATYHDTIDCAETSADSGNREADNDRVLEAIRSLGCGETLVLLQPRIDVTLAGWQVRGDIDILRLARGADGALGVLIVDMKASTSAKVEHRLQVAFYAEMLDALLAEAGGARAGTRIGVLYRGPADDLDEATRDAQHAAAGEWFGTSEHLLEIVADAGDYRRSVRELVTDPASAARRVADAGFDTLRFHLDAKCDGCPYNEFCMKRAAERDDLSLVPHLTPTEKGALVRCGIESVAELATLREPPPDDPRALVSAPGAEDLNARLAATWPVGPRLDELIHRARRYRRWKGDGIEALTYIPSKGYGSLPYCDADQNPNLVRIYLDAQHDYLHDRVWLLGARIVACEGGVERPERRRTVVHIADGPPDTDAKEGALFVRWVRDTLRAALEVAAPDADGAKNAPVHLIFYDRQEQKVLLDGLARHLDAVFGATPLYDFMTQLAAFESPLATFLSDEIRELKNYPILCQSLHAVAAILRFDWGGEPEPYAKIFRARLFDSRARLDPDDTESTWYTARARFKSQIPLEYAYAAWGEMPDPEDGKKDDAAPYRAATVADIVGFEGRRLAAMECIAKEFPGNRQTEKRPFALPDLADFDDTARSLADALDEFVTIERFVTLGAWKSARLAPPERRVLAGLTLVGRYDPARQEPGVGAINAENARRYDLMERYKGVIQRANPGVAGLKLPKQQRDETKWSQEGMRIRLELVPDGIACTLTEALALSTLKVGEGVVVCPRWAVDSRLPPEERTEFTPTPKQMLYGTRASIVEINPREGYVVVEMRGQRGGTTARGFTFGSFEEPFRDGIAYTLDVDPNDWYGYFTAKVTEGLRAGGANTLYERLAGLADATATWPDAAVTGQAQFLAGLDALHAAGALHPFEQSKRDFIGGHGGDPILLVHGPPGTGKSYATAFALYARLQGALAANMPFRAIVSCKTHAATDVLLANIVAVRAKLASLRETQPTVFAAHFDPRLLELPLMRMAPQGAVPDGVVVLPRDDGREPGSPRAIDRIKAEVWCIVATTPGGVYRMTYDRWKGKPLLGNELADCLVLDEASQMNLPEACMAALLLKPDGRVVVVGDPRQMPPIIKHDWEAEPRRTFARYRAYESLFNLLLHLDPPMVKFSESFRLHADMAEFLRREIYAKDGIPYFSHNHATLDAHATGDAFVDAVLSPDHPLVVVIHDEDRSQLRNPFEEALIAPVLRALAAPPYGLGPVEGLGVVVPHRAQRSALREDMPQLTLRDDQGNVVLSAVDTVERFQGGEREAIIVSATESDRDYLLVAGDFLLDPRRLTVALSRAKRKMVLVASGSVFTLFSADEETFAHAQLWKNLRHRTCTVPLWKGERDGVPVTVWGNDRGVPVL